ncbi:MAG: zf-HC2 domain-containing protein [bacterium]|nr:zf-HC2 domain-containing protein [bacterium]
MLTCRDVSQQADTYLDGELSLWQRMRTRLHLSMCHGCRRFMAQMRATRGLIDAETGITPPVSSADNRKIDDILSALGEEKRTDLK